MSSTSPDSELTTPTPRSRNWTTWGVGVAVLVGAGLLGARTLQAETAEPADTPCASRSADQADAPCPGKDGEDAPCPGKTDSEDAPCPGKTDSEDAPCPGKTNTEDAPCPGKTNSEAVFAGQADAAAPLVEAKEPKKVADNGEPAGEDERKPKADEPKADEPKADKQVAS